MRMRIRKPAVLLWILLPFLAAPAATAQGGNEPARRLTARGTDNLVAFTRLLGYVRFFHPSDQAAGANWDSLALAGVQAAERAASPRDLAVTLEDFFRPVAPTLRVFPTGSRPDLPAELAPPGGDSTLTYWQHSSVGLTPNDPFYKSERLTARGTPPGETGLPLPGEPLTVDLGGGVSAAVPLTLYTGPGGTIPSVSLPPPVPDKPAGFVPSGNDRTTRLADVALAWTILQHFYPYFDVVRVDWPAELRRALTNAAKASNERAFLDVLRGMTAALQDGHGYVFHPSQPLTHQLPLVWEWIENRLVITHAAAPGLARGDVVLAINGRPTAQVLAAEEKLVSAATPQFRRHLALRSLSRGSRDGEVRLKVQRGGKAVTVAVRRSAPAGTVEEPRPEKISELTPGIFYVDIDRISDDDFRAAFNRLGAARGIVFDLRGHPNGSLIAVKHLAGEPLRSPRFHVPLVTRPDREGVRFEDVSQTYSNSTPRLTARAVFLTDGRAVSYAETYMSLVEQHRLAEIVGGPTAGTNGDINPFVLPGGYNVWWTGLRVLKQDGSRHHGVGIQPTVPFSRTLEGVLEGRDELLEKGMEIVSR
jgi:C-terminal processing protease CtpA/Prc